MGISKRIARIPRGFQIGKTWIFLAHNKAVWSANLNTVTLETDYSSVKFVPGVIAVFLPQAIEMPVPKIITEDELQVIRSRGITPVPCEVDGYGRAIEMVEAKE